VDIAHSIWDLHWSAMGPPHVAPLFTGVEGATVTVPVLTGGSPPLFVHFGRSTAE